MNCPACGAQNASDARFCNMCGARISADTPLSNPSAAYLGPSMSTSGLRGAPDPMSSTQSVSLSAIGVQSSGRTYAVIGAVAAALVCAGALGMWLFSSPAPSPGADPLPPPPPNSPMVIGTPLPVGEEPPAPDFVAGGRSGTTSGTGGAPRATGSSTAPGSSATRTNGATPAVARTTTTTTTTRATGGTATRTGTTAATGGSAAGRSGGASAGGSGGAGGGTTGGTTGGESGSGTASAGSSGGTAGTGGGTDTIPADVGDERDIAASLYASQVRRVISQFYSARAQACFEHASRNTEIRGTVVVTFTITPSGQVSHAAVDRNTTGDDSLGRCLAGEVNTWRLPAPGDEAVEMSIPFAR